MSEAVDFTDILAAILQNSIWTKEGLKMLMLVRQRLDALEERLRTLETTNEVLVTHALAGLGWGDNAEHTAPELQDEPVLSEYTEGDDRGDSV